MNNSTPRGKKLLQWLSSTVGIGLIIGYFAWFSPPGLFVEVCRVDPLWLIAGILFYGIFLVLSTVRWGNLLSPDPRTLPWRDLSIVTLIAKGLGSITPMNAGEFYKAELSHRILSERRSAQYGIVAVERVLDVVTLLIAAVIGIFAQPKLKTYFVGHIPMVIGLIVVACIVTVIAFIVLYKWSQKLRTVCDDILSSFSLLRTRKSIIPLTLLLWLAITTMWWLLAAAFHVKMSYPDALLLMSVTTFLIIGSFIPGGLGIADMGASGIAILLGYQPHHAFLLPFAMRTNTLISILYGAVGWVLRPQNKNPKNR